MPWFLVGDQFPTHPKALATSLAARGLWVTAGAWSSAHLTDGVVRDHELASLGGTPELAAELVAAGLWRRFRRGYKFIPDVTHKIPSAKAVDNERKAAADRQKRRRDALLSRRDNGVTNGVSHTTQSNPDPDPYGSVVGNGTGSARASPEMVDLIMKEIEMATGRRIGADYAQRTYANIIGSRHPDNPAAYVKSAIRNEPNPRVRFLPNY